MLFQTYVTFSFHETQKLNVSDTLLKSHILRGSK